MRREALNLTIFPKGGEFKLPDPGNIHQYTILSFAAAMWQMTEGYEREKYNLGWFSCLLKDGHCNPACPLVYPDRGFLSASCNNCDHFVHALKLYKEAHNIEDIDRAHCFMNDDIERWVKKIGGFCTTGTTMQT